MAKDSYGILTDKDIRVNFGMVKSMAKENIIITMEITL